MNETPSVRPQIEIRDIYKDIEPASDEVFFHLHELLENQPNCAMSIAAACADAQKADLLTQWLEFAQTTEQYKGKFTDNFMRDGALKHVSRHSDGKFTDVVSEFDQFCFQENMIAELKKSPEETISKGSFYFGVVELLALHDFNLEEVKPDDMPESKSHHLVVEAFFSFLGITKAQIEVLQEYRKASDLRSNPASDYAVQLVEKEIAELTMTVDGAKAKKEEFEVDRSDLIRGVERSAKQKLDYAPQAFRIIFRA